MPTNTFRAAVAERFGPPEVIRLVDLPAPQPGPGEVLVAVRTAGLNPVDSRIRSGGFGGQPPVRLGTEFAGVVAAVGPGVTAWQPGDAVIGWGARGADADLVVTDQSRLADKPDALDWDLAGGLSAVGQTALTALDTLQLPPGATVVVHGASGGVGTVLTQLAVAAGLKVIGTAGPASQDHLRSLGATPVLYGDGLAERLAAAAPQGIDASIDLAGTAEAGDVARAVIAAGGRAVTLVPETLASHGLPLVQVRHSRAQLDRLVRAVLAGELRLPVEAIPFTDIVAAHRRLDTRHAVGKIVLDLSDNPYLD